MKLDTLESVAKALDRHGVRFIVVGGLAVAAHGYVRNTVDVDFVIRLEPANIHAAFAALAELGYVPTVPVSGEQFKAGRSKDLIDVEYLYKARDA